jgi:hypothetical protein
MVLVGNIRLGLLECGSSPAFECRSIFAADHCQQPPLEACSGKGCLTESALVEGLTLRR